MYGVSEGPNIGWTAGPIDASIAAGAVLAAQSVHDADAASTMIRHRRQSQSQSQPVPDAATEAA
jgi:hypothetical protein